MPRTYAQDLSDYMKSHKGQSTSLADAHRAVKEKRASYVSTATKAPPSAKKITPSVKALRGKKPQKPLQHLHNKPPLRRKGATEAEDVSDFLREHKGGGFNASDAHGIVRERRLRRTQGGDDSD